MKKFWKIKINLIHLYTVSIFLVVVFFAFFLSFFITRQMSDFLISQHVQIYPEIIKINLIHHEETAEFLKSSNPKPGSPAHDHGINGSQSVTDLFDNYMTFRQILGLEVYNSSRLLVYKKQKTEFQFPDDHMDLIESSLTGRINHVLYHPDRNDMIFKNEIMVIFIPIYTGGEITGVFKIFEYDEDFFSSLDKNVFAIQLSIVISGLLLYLTLFTLFYRSYRNQRKTTVHLETTQDVIIFALGYQAELRDKETGKHLERTAMYVEIIAKELLNYKKYRNHVTENYIKDLVRCAPLHDIGKVAIPDEILLKPATLTADEFEIIKGHTVYGAKLLEKCRDRLTYRSLFDLAIVVARNHHEKWNGTGYPDRLQGEQIPLAARIMTVADVYDALRSNRSYKNQFTHEKARETIIRGSGTQFDPEIIEIFEKHEKRFEEISVNLED